MGVNAVSWSPALAPGQLTSASLAGQPQAPLRRFVTGGSDSLVKLWSHNATTNSYDNICTLTGHTDWVRDVAWSPTPLSKSYIASASQDHTVRIWTCAAGADQADASNWKSEVLEFEVVVWRCSWSMAGNVLAVSGGDNRMEALRLADAFRARVVDATTESLVFEMTGAGDKLDAFIALMRPLGLREVSRTGVVAIARGTRSL